ncbi:sugar ABC transporter permease [Hydrogenispora ethanolica]
MSNLTPPKWLGLNNYVELMQDQRFLMSVFRTLYFSVLALLFETVFGVAIALLLNRDFLGKNIVKTLFLLPMIATPVAVGLIWMLIYEPTIGFVNVVVKALGFQPLAWLGSPKTAFVSLLIVDIWEWTSMIALIVLAGLSALPHDPYESATVDGANGWQVLWKITIPLVSPTIMIAALLRLIDALKTFDIFYVTTQGGPDYASETVNILGYIQGFQYFTFGKASALLVIFFIIVLLISLGFIKVKNKVGVDF